MFVLIGVLAPSIWLDFLFTSFAPFQLVKMVRVRGGDGCGCDAIVVQVIEKRNSDRCCFDQFVAVVG